MPGIRLDPRAELVAVCDPNEELLASGARPTGASTRSRRAIEEIAADPDVDAVIIATPNFTHLADRDGRVPEAGKHVMCEKPLGLNAAEVREMYHAAARRRRACT